MSMKNYQDNLNKYKYNQSDIFNSNINYNAVKLTPGKKLQPTTSSNIFNTEPVEPFQSTRVVKPSITKSQIFTNEPVQPVQQNKSQIKLKEQQPSSDIFNTSPQKQVSQPRYGKKQNQNKLNENGQSQDFPKMGKKFDSATKKKDNEQLIFTNDETSYRVKKDRTKDYSTLEAKLEQKRAQYNVDEEKFDYMKSKINHGSDQSHHYKNFNQSKQQIQAKKEKASFNSHWWSESNTLTKVGEEANFDRATYAHDKKNRDFQSSIFMTEEQAQKIPSKLKEIEKDNIEKMDMVQSQVVQDINNRKQDRNYSDLNGFQQQESKNEGFKNKQSDLLPANVRALNHDSLVYKNVGPNEENSNALNLGHDGQSQPSSTIPLKPNQNNNNVSEKFENFQVIEDFEPLDEAGAAQNNQQTAKQKQEIEVSNYNKSQIKSKQRQITEDPQRQETWEQDPYKDRVSLLQQRKEQAIPVQVYEMDLKGLSEKFDIAHFKKVCARKGYHLVDLDLQYNLNKPTGRGKLILRNSRKVTDGSDSIKTHLKSCGIGVTKEGQRDATLNNNKLKLEPDSAKKKVFSKPVLPKSRDNDNDSQMLGSEISAQPKKRVSQINSRLYSGTASSQNKNKPQQELQKANVQSVNAIISPKAGTKPPTVVQKKAAVIQKQETEKVEQNKQEQIQAQQQEQKQEQGHKREGSKSIQDLLGNNNSESGGAVIRKKPKKPETSEVAPSEPVVDNE